MTWMRVSQCDKGAVISLDQNHQIGISLKKKARLGDEARRAQGALKRQLCRLMLLLLAPSASGYMKAYLPGAPRAFDNTGRSEELGNDVDEELPAEELGNDVDEELPDFQSIFGKDIPLDCLPLLDFGDPDDGPCWICDGPHAESYCGYRYHCPLDLKGKKIKSVLG
ncbi:hypothetical protein CASFOL_041959 [Castilleja foliolosa]|uniref:Uncharacterized protein n=1 Tax=Castilleja foliolosa TaxID=1961234 RepID=A0ABD3BAJ1_9LAMI